MGKMGWWRGGRLAGAVFLGGASLAALAAPLASNPQLSSRAQEAESSAVQTLVRWATVDGDARGRPFAVVDKPSARIHVFAADGRLISSAPTLLGSALGDRSAAGVGERVLTGIPAEQRTTPAGRFPSEPGRNLQGEAVVWVDYDAAIAVHRLRPGPAAERRPQRLSSATVADNRITLGCIVVDPGFYDEVIAPLLGRQRGIVYVLPDSGDWRVVFQAAAGL
jgi:hypothetical protein